MYEPQSCAQARIETRVCENSNLLTGICRTYQTDVVLPCRKMMAANNMRSRNGQFKPIPDRQSRIIVAVLGSATKLTVRQDARSCPWIGS